MNMNNMMIMIRDKQNQLSNIGNSINLRPLGEFSSKIEVNSREHVNATTLRCGK